MWNFLLLCQLTFSHSKKFKKVNKKKVIVQLAWLTQQLLKTNQPFGRSQHVQLLGRHDQIFSAAAIKFKLTLNHNRQKWLENRKKYSPPTPLIYNYFKSRRPLGFRWLYIWKSTGLFSNYIRIKQWTILNHIHNYYM